MIVYKPTSYIRAISFDLDDTLYDNMPHIYEAERCLREYMAKNFPATNTIEPHIWQCIRTKVIAEQPELINDLSTLRTTILTKGFMQTSMHIDRISAAVKDCYDYFYFKRSDFTVEKKVQKSLKKLAKKVPLAAITNGNVNLAAIGIEKYFSCIIQASKVQPMKPHPSMFQYVTSQLNIPAKNILHVGDDLEKDIKGANDAGYQSAWYAVNRPMNLNTEKATLLPNIQLGELNDLHKLLKK